MHVEGCEGTAVLPRSHSRTEWHLPLALQWRLRSSDKDQFFSESLLCDPVPSGSLIYFSLLLTKKVSMMFSMFIQPFFSLLSTLLLEHMRYFNATLQLHFFCILLKWSHELKKECTEVWVDGIGGLVCRAWAGFFSRPFFQQFNCPDAPCSQLHLWQLVTTAESWTSFPKSQKLNLNQHFSPTATSCSGPKWFEKFKSLSKYCQMKFLISRSQPINYLIITTQTSRLKEVHWDDLEPYLPFIISFKTAPQSEVCIYPKNLNVLAKLHAEI